MPTRASLPTRSALAACLALIAPVCGAAAEVSNPQVIAVMIDNAKLMRLPERTQTVVVGNPSIADVALQKNGVVILTGKSFGQTNLIALDGAGAMLAESTISVRPSEQNSVVIVQRGPDKRNSYSCTPNCLRSVQLGDATEYFADVSNQAEAHRNQATGATR